MAESKNDNDGQHDRADEQAGKRSEVQIIHEHYMRLLGFQNRATNGIHVTSDTIEVDKRIYFTFHQLNGTIPIRNKRAGEPDVKKGLYMHFKGGFYFLNNISKFATNGPDEGKWVITYENERGEEFSRWADDFFATLPTGSRFTKVL